MSFKMNPIQPDDLSTVQQIALLRQSGFPKIAGYQIECEIGHGGMATVYRAVQQSLNRPVAIKILASGSGDDPDFAQRFKKEGEILAQLSHPNIMTIYDIGIFENNRIYLSVEYLSGGTLKDKIQQVPISFENAIEITQSIAKALRYAHQRGVIHRDVKPSNIMFNEEGAPVLTDFGIARAKQSKTIHTVTGLIIGSPGYMSPEQAMGETATIQSDLYGLGVVLYEMLTGKPIYSADNTLAILLKHINDPIPKLPKNYARLQPVFNKLVAKNSHDRYSNADEFMEALDGVMYQKTTSKLNKDFSPQPSLKLNFLLPRKAGLFIGAGFVGILVISLAAVHLFFSESAKNPIESAKPTTAIQPPLDRKSVV